MRSEGKYNHLLQGRAKEISVSNCNFSDIEINLKNNNNTMFMPREVIECKGVTLIELVVVLAIIAIVAVLVAIGPEFVSTDRVRSTSKELLSDLQWIRQSAMTQGPDTIAPQMRGFGIRIESTNRYRLFRFNDSDLNFTYNGGGEEAPLTAVEVTTRQRDIFSTVELKINSGGTLVDPNNNILIFDHLGLARQANWGFFQGSIVILNPNISSVQPKCVTVTFNRIR